MHPRTLLAAASIAVAFNALSQAPAPAPAPAAPKIDSMRIAQAPGDRPIDSATASAILHLFETMGIRRNFDKMLGMVFDNYRVSMPSVPPETWDEMRKEIKTDDVITMLLPIYARNLSLADIQSMDAFFSSSAGKHYVDAEPQILQQTMAASQAWGMEIGKKVVEQLKMKGYVKSS